MDAFIRKHASFLMSTALVVGSLLLLGYMAVYAPRAAMIADLQAMRTIFQRESRTLEDEIKKIREAEARAQEGDAAVVAVQSLPNFLRHINDLARKSNVIIDQLTPEREGILQFQLSFKADYFTFLNFTSQLESLNVAVNNMQVRPYKPSVERPIHAISFTITPRNDAEPLESARLKTIHEQVAAVGKRNPFRRYACERDGQNVCEQVLDTIDLTWVNQLTGIGRINDNRTATIDGEDYAVDDIVDGKKITEILGDRVYLERDTPNGLETYVLKFRQQIEEF